MSYLLALDQGTTSSRALVFDGSGAIRALAQREFTQIYPRPGLVEHDPGEIASSQMDVAAQALADAGISAREVAAIGITNQRETCLLWDRRSGEPCGNALVWQDRRTADACNRLRADGAESLVQARTGLLLDPYFSASKLAWMLAADATLARRAAAGELAFGTIDSWLVWQLTDGRRHVTDATNASRTMLYDIHRGDWDDELLALWQVPRAVLPEVVDSSGVIDTSTRFGSEIPIAGIAGDQQAALFGQQCFERGMAKCTYGTGCFVLMQTGDSAAISRNRLLTTVAERINGETRYALEGSVFMGGATIQWLRDGLGIIDDAAQSEALAASVTSTDGVVLVPAFTGLGAPHWDADARALLIGMTRGTSRAHVARAALEAIAWQVADVVGAMTADSDTAVSELRVDGGATANGLLMQLQADFLQARLSLPAISESTALGAALLAGLGVGLWPDRASLAATRTEAAAFLPQRGADDIAPAQAEWRRAVTRARNWTTAD